MDLSSFLTVETIKKINEWEEQFNVKVILGTPSKSRIGVFIPKLHTNHIIKMGFFGGGTGYMQTCNVIGIITVPTIHMLHICSKKFHK